MTDDLLAKIKELEAVNARNDEALQRQAVLLEQESAGRRHAEAKLREYTDRLQALSRRLVDVQEEERRRVARELHDDIGQMLTCLPFVLDSGPEWSMDMFRAKLAEARTLVDSLLARVRELSYALRPAMLDHLGLLPALVPLFKRYTEQSGTVVRFQHEGIGRRFEPAIETAAYRMVQEALTNVARHAAVPEVAVRLWADADKLGVQIQDQGAGFDPQTALAAGGRSGLAGLLERVTLLGGDLLIESGPGTGTQLTAHFPVRQSILRTGG
jgi:signal transduction histidine kinase